MRFLSVVVGLVLFTGCKDATKDFEGLADRACQCAEDDAACANKVLADLVAFTAHTKISDGNLQRITQAGARISNCLVGAGAQPDRVTAALEKMAK